tara:strand:- start:352 stop:603 length:252 start_codon:yes stop_codon:yes gene_type:complete
MANGDLNVEGWDDDWDSGYFDEDGIWRQYGDFDIFEEAVVDETGNFYKYDSGNGKKPPIWTRIGGRIYGLAIIWIVLSTKPWK